MILNFIMSGKILQSQSGTLVLIDYSIDESTNTVKAMMSYFESGLVSPTEVTDLSTDESYMIIIPDEILALGTYAIDLERVYELY